MMKILFLDAYYEPETIAYSHLEKDLIEGLIEEGHKIHIICPVPTRGISDEIRDSYREIKHETKYNGNVTVDRFWAPQEGRNPLIRALRYFWCNIRTYSIGIKMDKVDAVFANSTPPTQGWIAGKVAKKLKVPFIYSLQDVFPDSLVGAGMTSENSLIYKIGRKIEDFTYRNADKIIVISEDIKKNIIRKGVPAEKIEIVPNWIDSQSVHPIEKKDNYLFEKYNIPKDKFTVVYAGNLGYAQNIEVIIKAAEVLKENNDIQFVIFGKGAQEDEYKKMADGLNNMMFLPIQPYSEVSYVYSLGDVSIVPCKKGFGGSAMPSKMWSIMATGTPVLASFDSGTDMENLIRSEEIGLFSESEDYLMLADNITEIFNSKDKQEMFGKNARIYVEEKRNREVCTQRYIDVIKQCISA